MKKILSFILIALFGSLSVFAKTDLSLTNTTLSNVAATVNANGSVTFSLIDAGSQGTIRFNDTSNFTSYQTIYYYYKQDNANEVSYTLNNQYVNNARKSNVPASTLEGFGTFDIQGLIAGGETRLNDSYYAIVLKSGTVTISSISCVDKISDTNVLLNGLNKYTTDNGNTFVSATANSIVKINGTGLTAVLGLNTTVLTTYLDLSS